MADIIPVFDHKKITVIFVLGGPGAGSYCNYHGIRHISYRFLAGKGTQCAKIVEDFHFCHLSGLYLSQLYQPSECNFVWYVNSWRFASG